MNEWHRSYREIKLSFSKLQSNLAFCLQIYFHRNPYHTQNHHCSQFPFFWKNNIFKFVFLCSFPRNSLSGRTALYGNSLKIFDALSIHHQIISTNSGIDMHQPRSLPPPVIKHRSALARFDNNVQSFSPPDFGVKIQKRLIFIFQGCKLL